MPNSPSPAAIEAARQTLLNADTYRDGLISFDDALNRNAEVIQQAIDKAQEWQPAETAPKDGNSLIVTDGTTIGIAMWYEGDPEYKEEGYNEDGEYIDKRKEASFTGGGFGISSYIGSKRVCFNKQPTHWMPLPQTDNGGE